MCVILAQCCTGLSSSGVACPGVNPRVQSGRFVKVLPDYKHMDYRNIYTRCMYFLHFMCEKRRGGAPFVLFRWQACGQFTLYTQLLTSLVFLSVHSPCESRSVLDPHVLLFCSASPIQTYLGLMATWHRALRWIAQCCGEWHLISENWIRQSESATYSFLTWCI